MFVDHCIATKDDARLESSLPVVTALAFRIQATYNDLLQLFQQEEEDQLLRGGMDDPEEEEERARKEERRIDMEFVIGEMLKLAANLDYADEIGRRKMFQLVRESDFPSVCSYELKQMTDRAGDMISHDVLPESLVPRCLDVLRVLSPNERDLIRVVVEVIHELRDPSEPEEESVSRLWSLLIPFPANTMSYSARSMTAKVSLGERPRPRGPSACCQSRRKRCHRKKRRAQMKWI